MPPTTMDHLQHPPYVFDSDDSDGLPSYTSDFSGRRTKFNRDRDFSDIYDSYHNNNNINNYNSYGTDVTHSNLRNVRNSVLKRDPAPVPEQQHLPFSQHSTSNTNFIPGHDPFLDTDSMESIYDDGNIPPPNHGAGNIDPEVARRDPAVNRGRYRKWKICVCGSLCFFIIALAIILPLLFLVQRKVDYVILPLAISDQVINIDPNGFTIPINPVIHTTNENFFDIGLSLNVAGKHPLYANGTIPLGSGSLVDATLKSRSEQDVSFPFLVQYNRTYDPDFAYFSDLLTNCSTPGNMKLYMDVALDVQYRTYIKSGSMAERRDVYIPCPITEEKANSIKALLASGMLTSAIPTPPALPTLPTPIVPITPIQPVQPIEQDPLWAVSSSIAAPESTTVPNIW
jgi:hypothetical protein